MPLKGGLYGGVLVMEADLGQESEEAPEMVGSIGPESFGELFDRLAGPLVLYARQWCDHSEAHDVVQEAFLALGRERRVPDHPEGWLYRVARNRAISVARGSQRRRRREAVVSSPEAWFAATDDQLDADEATALLAELPVDQREIVVARVWGGLTFDAIGRLQGCSAATCHRRYQEGLTRLHERMVQPCPRETT